MTLDFTLEKYRELCQAMKTREVMTFRDYLTRQKLPDKYVILRHDIDRKPGNALKMADLEHEIGIHCTYYFRMKPHTFKPEIIQQIESMGHEIGFHYETLDKAKGNQEQAREVFVSELSELRNVCVVETICAHGNPLTKWHNELIWDTYDYREYQLSGEAFLSLNDGIRYFTDTSRSWNWKYRLKDVSRNEQEEDENVKCTDNLIRILLSSSSDPIHICVHPERWSSGFWEWSWRLLEDEVINIGKRTLFAVRRS